MRPSRCLWGVAVASVCAGPPAMAQVTHLRSIDGTGNNIGNFTLGSANTVQIRETVETYTDGIAAMLETPNARAVSNAVGYQTAAMDQNPLRLSSMFWQWGQFLDHDIVLTTTRDSDTYDIVVPADDPVMLPGSSFALHRSHFAAGTGTSNPRQFRNANTHWIDASMVYGSDAPRAAALRTFVGGGLAPGGDGFMRRHDDALTSGLPNANDPQIYPDNEMFLAGDVRANEQAGLTVMHEVFFRYHNHLAQQFAADNPTWTDEQLYQAARKLVGASVQKITYQDWLPLLLNGNNLDPYTGYDSNVDPSIALEFSTAVFRFGHTMLNERLLRLNADKTEFAGGHLNLFQSFFNPDVVTEPGSLDAILRGLVWQESNDLDTQVIEDVRSLLFGPPGSPGQDLLALNIQRGRDHGIGTLNDLRAAFGLTPHADFDDLTSDATLAASLAGVYADIDEVDAWVGLMAEDDLNGGLLGETLTIAMMDQFERLRDGDRYFYLSDPGLAPYLNQVLDTDLCDIIALVTGVDEFRHNVFMVGARPPLPEPVSAIVLVGLLVCRVPRTSIRAER